MITEQNRDNIRDEQLNVKGFVVFAVLPNDPGAKELVDAMISTDVGPDEFIGGGHARLQTNVQELMGGEGTDINTAERYKHIDGKIETKIMDVGKSSKAATVMFMSAEADLHNRAVMQLVKDSRNSTSPKISRNKPLMILRPHSDSGESQGITDEQAMAISLAHHRPVIYSNAPMNIGFTNGDLSATPIEGNRLKKVASLTKIYDGLGNLAISDFGSEAIVIPRTEEMSQKVSIAAVQERAEKIAEGIAKMDAVAAAIGGEVEQAERQRAQDEAFARRVEQQIHLGAFGVPQVASTGGGSDDGVVGKGKGKGKGKRKEDQPEQPEQKKPRFSGVGL